MQSRRLERMALLENTVSDHQLFYMLAGIIAPRKMNEACFFVWCMQHPNVESSCKRYWRSRLAAFYVRCSNVVLCSQSASTCNEALHPSQPSTP